MQWPWKRTEADLDREVAYHLETLADAYERQGLSRKEAMRQARKEFGAVEKVKDECRDESRWNWLAQAAQDIRFGWRMMRKTPATTIAAVLSLALGIGATTAILSLADAVLWRSLGVPAPEQLSEALWQAPKRPEGLMSATSGDSYRDNGAMVADFFSLQSFDALRSRAAGKAEVAGHIGTTVVSASYSGSVLTAGLRGVSGNFFSMLQLQPVDGRLLADRDATAGSAPSVPTNCRRYESLRTAARDFSTVARRRAMCSRLASSA